MRAVNNYIIIDKIKEETKTMGGFVLTEDQNKEVRYLKGKILSIGNLVEGVNPDDIIYYDRRAGHNIEFKEKLHHVIKIQDVVIVE